MKRDQSEPPLPQNWRPSPFHVSNTTMGEPSLYDRVTSIEYMVESKECFQCRKLLSNCPAILCARCDAVFCVPCFRSPSDVSAHRSTHDYYVLDRLSYPVYSPGWTAREELLLLQGTAIPID